MSRVVSCRVGDGVGGGGGGNVRPTTKPVAGRENLVVGS